MEPPRGAGLTYSGMMSTPAIAPATHPVIVWTDQTQEGLEPWPIARGSVWFIDKTEGPPIGTPGQMKPTMKIVKRPGGITGSEPIVAAEAVQWVRIKNSQYYMASLAVTLAGTDVISLDKGPANRALDIVKVRGGVLPAGSPVYLQLAKHISKTNVIIDCGGPPKGATPWYSSNTQGYAMTYKLLGYTSTVTRQDDPYAMVHFVPGHIVAKST